MNLTKGNILLVEDDTKDVGLTLTLTAHGAKAIAVFIRHEKNRNQKN